MKTYIDPGEVALMERMASNLRDRLLIRILFRLGCRVREFLLGNGPHGSPAIDPNIGAPQSDIFYHYKTALINATALDRATRQEEKQARREKRGIDPNNIDVLVKRNLSEMPYKTSSCRYHSFVVYFSDLQRLGWVQPSGRVERSAFQDNYPPGPPRRYYRLTADGIHAGDAAWANPHLALYG